MEILFHWRHGKYDKLYPLTESDLINWLKENTTEFDEREFNNFFSGFVTSLTIKFQSDADAMYFKMYWS